MIRYYIRALDWIGAFVLVVSIAVQGVAYAAIVEAGDLNVIDDPGNPSDGLRYLDMTYSTGLTSAAALTNAQLTYADARLAEPYEWDNLVAAAGIGFDGTQTVADAFSIGLSDFYITSGTSYDGGALSAALGYTSGSSTYIWSDPDGDGAPATTRDYLFMNSDGISIIQNVVIPAQPTVGWLLVSEPVPEPRSYFVWSLLGFAAICTSVAKARRRGRTGQ